MDFQQPPIFGDVQSLDSGNILPHDGGGTFLTRAEYGLIKPLGQFPVPFNPVDNVVL